MMVCHAHKGSAALSSQVSAFSSLERRKLSQVGLMLVQHLGCMNL